MFSNKWLRGPFQKSASVVVGEPCELDQDRIVGRRDPAHVTCRCTGGEHMHFGVNNKEINAASMSGTLTGGPHGGKNCGRKVEFMHKYGDGFWAGIKVTP